MTLGHMPFRRVRVLRVPFRRGRAPGRTPVGVAGTGVAGFTFRAGFFGAGAYVCPAAW